MASHRLCLPMRERAARQHERLQNSQGRGRFSPECDGVLWDEYIERHPDGYRYSRFCELYRGWASRLR